jgi:membrane protease YdiL (CAAX protease family)
MYVALESFLKPVAAATAKHSNAFATWMETWKAVLPIPLLLLILPVVWLFFRNTWRELDEDAHRHRAEVLAQGRMDYRPFIALVMCAVILTMQEYYGGRVFFDVTVRSTLVEWDKTHPWIQSSKYDELWGFAWWAGTRIFGYVLPFIVWKAFYRHDSLLDFGLRTRGFLDHAWIYGLFLVVVVPAMLVVSQSPDFGSYYPFYKQCSRSWFDFLTWEAMYFAQFFALEMFFRGFWLGVLRKSFGSGAIFVMAVPYCMIHYGKPYLEACGAIVAGIALGSLSMKTKSIYSGFLVHITVAAMMDWLSLRHRHATPITLWPQEPNVTTSLVVEAETREAIADSVERGATIAFFVVLAVFVLIVLRHRRMKWLAT